MWCRRPLPAIAVASELGAALDLYTYTHAAPINRMDGLFSFASSCSRTCTLEFHYFSGRASVN